MNDKKERTVRLGDREIDLAISYPYNVAEALTRYAKEQNRLYEITPSGVQKLVDTRLNTRSRDVFLRYTRDGDTLEDIGKTYNITRERVRHLIIKAIINLCYFPAWGDCAVVPLEVHNEVRSQLESEREAAIQERDEIKQELDWFKERVVEIRVNGESDTQRESPILDRPLIDVCKDEMLSIRSHNCLARAGFNTLREVTQVDERTIRNIKYFGKRSLCEVVDLIHKVGGKMLWEREDDFLP